ncbi:MAG: ATP-binding cassette domain-containing protein [Flavobacteriales bacterium]|nr:ATP-binding cassette domain-containing protein [Flavobacteriales bacterium]
MPSKNIIEIENLHKSYSGHKALEDINLNIKKSKIFGLLGPNGAGKTTLIRIINQIMKPDSGTIKFDGENLSRKHVYSIGYLPEERGLYKKMKVGEQALYLAQLKGLSKKEAKEKLNYWFEKLQVTNWWHKRIEDLSKGMAQKIQFITTILHEPKVIILDEPLSGLDPANSLLIKKEILELKKKKTSIILSTHDMNSVEEICDEAAIINKSKKIIQGNIENLKERYQDNLWSIEYIGNQMSFSNAVWGGWEIIKHHRVNEKNNKAEIKLFDNLTINQFTKGIIDHVEIVEIRKKTPSIQDVFLKATANE